MNRNPWFQISDDFLCQPDVYGVICGALNLGSFYIELLGVLGAIFSFFEFYQVFKRTERLPAHLKRKRVKGRCISPGKERDIKLITNLMTTCFYFLMIIGAVKDEKGFVYPWFIMQTIILGGEFIIFLARLCKLRTLNITRMELFCTVFSILNWVQVFCFIQKDRDYSPCWWF